MSPQLFTPDAADLQIVWRESFDTRVHRHIISPSDQPTAGMASLAAITSLDRK